MSFNPLMGLVTASLLPYLPESPTVVELGNQRFKVDNKQLQEIIRMVRHRNRCDLDRLNEFLMMSDEEKLPFVDSFYRTLGFKEYVAIDVNAKYGSIVMDLNLDLKEHYNYHETFDLVTNNGTGEHIFNQHMVFKNMHQLTKPGGLMVHVMPFVTCINHGFFNFHPILYVDLAAANNYRIIKLSLANRSGREVVVKTGNNGLARSQANSEHNRGSYRRQLKKRLEKIPVFGSLAINAVKKIRQRVRSLDLNPYPVTSLSLTEALESLNLYNGRRLWRALRQLMNYPDSVRSFGNVLVVSVLQKRDDGEFKVPVQGKYFRDIEEERDRQRYHLSNG